MWSQQPVIKDIREFSIIHSTSLDKVLQLWNFNIRGLQTATSTITVSWVAELRGPFEDGTWRSSLPKCQVECCIQSWPNELQNVKLQSSYMQLYACFYQINSHCSLWNFAPAANEKIEQKHRQSFRGIVHHWLICPFPKLSRGDQPAGITKFWWIPPIEMGIQNSWTNGWRKWVMASQVSCLQLLSHMLLTH